MGSEHDGLIDSAPDLREAEWINVVRSGQPTRLPRLALAVPADGVAAVPSMLTRP
ncbi:hypothetical protein [Micromonospora sp. NPDC005171]|uniref:hypothetical protein n=1 Tax=Micromonospora sp. NPDC005171 TaxID=3156866 RepID=UPI0033B21EF3